MFPLHSYCIFKCCFILFVSFQGLISVDGFGRMWQISEAGGRIVFFKYVCRFLFIVIRLISSTRCCSHFFASPFIAVGQLTGVASGQKVLLRQCQKVYYWVSISLTWNNLGKQANKQKLILCVVFVFQPISIAIHIYVLVS